jgi:hypothetical protein
MPARVKTREDDERELQMLRLRDLRWPASSIAKRFGIQRKEAVRTILLRIDADTARSEAN